MEIILKNPLIVLDIEATGDSVTKDRIVELGMIKVFDDGREEVFDKRLNPEIPIPINISEIHGIYDIDVKNCPTFKELANEIKEFIADSNLCGFNSNKFDIPILEEEFLRADINLNFKEKKLIDVQNIFHKMEKRTLSAAYNFYCSKEMDNAHSAIHDARATLDVLKAQTRKYEELENSVDFLSEFSKVNSRAVDYAARIIIDENNIPTINFGKHKGKSVKSIFDKEPGYYSWILRSDFAHNTKSHFTDLWNEYKKGK